MRRFLIPFLALAFVILMPRTAFPWGNAPTHFSIGNDLANNHKYSILPATDSPQLFIRANACPDLAWTQTFKNAGLSYIHTLAFADALYYVALEAGNSNWITIAHGYGAHIAADNTVHTTLLANVDEPIHSLVEVSIDTIIYYNGTPIDHSKKHPAWKKINVGIDACDPDLFNRASSRYKADTDYTVPTIQWWNMQFAVLELASSIAAEYTYHELKGNTDLSEAYLQSLVIQGVLPGPWEPVYQDSLDAAEIWIDFHY
ncbi:hypothetical protein [Candidatus Deferrimicrobium sp.]|uniref:hypothetical protein n=1 Tax=Candidatus Deferrimicrobium sp. TaxID=3060586 RepID=UPI002ED2532E